MFSGSKFSLLAKSILVLTLLVAPALAKRKHDKPKPIGCGESGDHLSSGSHKSDLKFPHHVYIYDNFYKRYVGSGVIIDDHHILTARKNVEKDTFFMNIQTEITPDGIIRDSPTRFHVVVGKTDFNSNDGETYQLSKVVFHRHADIALIRTSDPIRFKRPGPGLENGINRVCPTNYRDHSPKYKLYVSGWYTSDCEKPEHESDKSRNLRMNELEFAKIDACPRLEYGLFCASATKKNEEDEDSMGENVFSGDVGSGVVRLVNGRFELVGLVSYPRDDHQCLKPNVYTKVEDYRHWVQHWINES